MFLASKFEDIKPLRLSELVFVTDSTYTEPEVLCIEQQMLETLDFNIVVPSAYRFLELFAEPCSSREVFHMAQYLCELALLEVAMLKYKQSMLAASALFSAELILSGQWTDALVKHTGY